MQDDFHELWRHHAADVRRFALYQTGDASRADDITSETFLRAWTSSSAVREATVRSYLFTIARRLAAAEWRREARHDTLPESLISPAPGPHEHAEQSAALRRVLTGLSNLPAIDRAALMLRVRDGLPYDDIATALGLSVAAVKVKVHRARLKLAALTGV